MLNDVLTCVDDFHPSGRKEEQELMEKAQMLARAYGDRVGRGRLRADSTLMPTRPVRGNAILTAEFPPEIGESGLARCFTVELRFGDLNMESYRFFEAESRRGVFQSCMLVFTQWLREKFLNFTQKERLGNPFGLLTSLFFTLFCNAPLWYSIAVKNIIPQKDYTLPETALRMHSACFLQGPEAAGRLSLPPQPRAAGNTE